MKLSPRLRRLRLAALLFFLPALLGACANLSDGDRSVAGQATVRASNDAAQRLYRHCTQLRATGRHDIALPICQSAQRLDPALPLASLANAAVANREVRAFPSAKPVTPAPNPVAITAASRVTKPTPRLPGAPTAAVIKAPLAVPLPLTARAKAANPLGGLSYQSAGLTDPAVSDRQVIRVAAVYRLASRHETSPEIKPEMKSEFSQIWLEMPPLQTAAGPRLGGRAGLATGTAATTRPNPVSATPRKLPPQPIAGYQNHDANQQPLPNQRRARVDGQQQSMLTQPSVSDTLVPETASLSIGKAGKRQMAVRESDRPAHSEWGTVDGHQSLFSIVKKASDTSDKIHINKSSTHHSSAQIAKRSKRPLSRIELGTL